MAAPVTLNIRQFVFLPAADGLSEESDTVIIHESLWHKWLPLYPVGTPMLVDIRNDANGIERVVCLGEPHTEDTATVFAPTWVVDNLGCDLDTPVIIEPHLEPVPAATLLVLRPMDTAIYHNDIRELFERSLDTFRVLQQGAMLTVHVDELGDYPVSAYVERTEPAELVRLGGEVRVEFLEPEGGVEEFSRGAAGGAGAAAPAAVDSLAETIAAVSALGPAAPVIPKLPTEEDKERARQARLRYFAAAAAASSSP